MKVGEVEGLLLERFPLADAEDWDHVGLSVGDPRADVARACCALDVTEANVRAAASHGATLLLTHHPIYLEAPAAITPVSPARPASGAALLAAARLGVSVISLHTNLDRSVEARELLPSLMGMEAVSSLEFPDAPARHGLGALTRPAPCTLDELAARAARTFSTEPRVWGPPEKEVRSVAFFGGSVGQMGERVLAAGADALVAGEAGYHVAQDLALRGCPLVLLGHDRSEEPFCTLLANALIEAGLSAAEVEVLHPPRAWWTAC